MKVLTILNLTSHPITSEQLSEVKRMTERDEIRVIPEEPIHFHFDESSRFLPQIEEVFCNSEFENIRWGGADDLLIVVPSLSSMAAVAVAYLHGLIGGFPQILRVWSVTRNNLTEWDVAEIVNLRDVRKAGRQARDRAILQKKRDADG